MPEPHHFSDYGFDPEIDYFQEVRNYKQQSSSRSSPAEQNHLIRFKLPKPISIDEQQQKNKKGLRRRRWWWKNAFLFIKSRWRNAHKEEEPATGTVSESSHHHRHRINGIGPIWRGSVSGPIYATESLGGDSGGSSPCYSNRRPTSGPLPKTMTGMGDEQLPYFNLRDLNMNLQTHRPAPALPVYLVT
ncbi:hypothetical protein Dimus_001669 [Dionaea muscipula]